MFVGIPGKNNINLLRGEKFFIRRHFDLNKIIYINSAASTNVQRGGIEEDFFLFI